MSGYAETLREAARLMRERATVASPSPWVVHDGTQWEASIRAISTGMTPGWRRIAQVNRLNPDATHIASWHPAVALAVADWLEAEVRAYRFAWDELGETPELSPHAIAVATAYLGQPAPTDAAP